MDFDFVSFFLGIAVGVGIAYFVVYYIGKIIYRRLEAAVEQHVKEETNTNRIDMKVERHGDMLYAFRSDNDGFVCQGTDLRDLRKQFAQRFPNYTGSIVGKTDDVHQELVKQLKEIKSEDSTGIRSTS